MSPAALFALVGAAGVLLTGLAFVIGFWDRIDDLPEDFGAPENPSPLEDAR